MADSPLWAPGGAAARRMLAALAGSLSGSLGAGAASGWLRAPQDRVGGALREAALFAPLAVPVAALVLPLALFASEQCIVRMRAPAAGANRGRLAATLLLAPGCVIFWIAVATRGGRWFMGSFHHAGLAALAQAVALTVFGAAFVGAAIVAIRRVASVLGAIPPPAALFAGVTVAGVALALSVATGNTDGGGGVLGAYGVLKKPELDLSPVYGLAAALALSGIVTTLCTRRAVVALGVLAVSSAATMALVVSAAQHFADAPSAAVIEARPSVARWVLRALRRWTDRDRDGASPWFGGGDCEDGDARINPEAVDVPGDGVDNDCSGADAQAVPLARDAPETVTTGPRPTVPRAMNLVLVTVDTLRWDLHFAGNPRPLSPNLDRLAADSVVFDQGYALSSYTGRAVAPMLAGRYPTECVRDDGHFTAYGGANVLLAERLAAAGFRTMGAASHFYFERRYGLSQGIQQWDLAARPGADEQETRSADAQVADRAIAMLRQPENATARFFLWVHFFDPHKQYVRHPELPVFGDGERARYDGEVQWTDRQIGRLLDALAANSFASSTAVVVTADHGEAFGEHGMSWHGVELWEELVRVPWIMHVPGVASRHVATPRSHIDLVPTLLELLGVPQPPPRSPDALSGHSLVPDLLGMAVPPRAIYIELPEGPFNSLRRSVVDNGWKLTERGSRRFELYHLAVDPGEHQDLVNREAGEAARMRSVLERVRGGLHTVAPSGGGR